MKTKNKTAISTLIAVTVAFFILVAFSATASADPPPCICGDICVNETGWWRAGGDFNASNTPIQHAIDNASAGDTICVKDGTYNENVDVNVDNLTIRSENGSASTIVNASNPNDHVFNVIANYMNISGFTVQNATGYAKAGIYLGNGVAHCNISNNTASKNWFGIYLFSSSNNTLKNNTAYNNSYYGIYLWYSSNNNLTNNTAYSNDYGIYLRSSCNYNTLSGNTAYNNSWDGIRLWSSSNNTLSSNIAYLNNYGIHLYSSSNYNVLTNNIVYNNSGNGIHLDWPPSNNVLTNNIVYNNSVHGIYLHYESDNNNITSNIVYNNSDSGIHVDFYSSNNMLTNNTAYSNNYGIYLRSPGSNNNNLTSNTAYNNSYYGIYLWGSSNNNLTNNTANENSNHGIYLYSSSYNMLSNNIVSNNQHGGIYLEWYSSNNNLTGNTINANNEYGIYLLDSMSNNNLIYNNYFNNTNNTRDEGNNIWNITKTAGTNIIGGSWLGGNYWSDYAGEDLDGDGLGNTLIPYNSSGNIQNGGDWHPLVLVGLTIEKSDNPDPVLAGGTLNYSIVLNNTGNGKATSVTVTETYDVNVTFVSAAPAPSQGNDTWIFPTLNVSETKAINISVTVNLSIPNGTVLHNLVNVTCDQGVTDSDTEDTTVLALPEPPNITSFAPPSPVNDTVCTWRNFNVTVNQTVNVSWYLNKSFRFKNESVKEANYTLHAEIVGEHNVSAVAENANGTDMQTWVWNVKSAPDTTPPIITFVPPTPANNSEVNVNHVFVNVTTNEPCNTAILNWNGSNGTMFGSGMNFYLNKTSLSDGIYSFKVYANDTANNWNVSETRIVEVNVTLPDTTPATVDFDPDTLNKKSKGKWVTVYTELPAGYNVTDLNVSTMMLNETVPAELHPTEIGDYDSDGIPDLMVKFDRQAVIAMLPVGDAVNVPVTGKLYDGTPFEGSDTIRVIDEG